MNATGRSVVQSVPGDRLRADPAWLPRLSLVAVEPPAERVVGHVVCTRGTVDGCPALGLGPLAVRPGRRRRGINAAPEVRAS